MVSKAKKMLAYHLLNREIKSGKKIKPIKNANQLNKMIERKESKMSNTTINKSLMVLVVVAVIGFGAYAFAHMGAGTGHQNWMHQGGGMHHYGYGTPGFGYPGDLSDEERKALDSERKTFFDSTEDLRGDIYSKQLGLRSELAKDKPDNQSALELQEKISELEAKLDQKHLEHMIKMRKISPHVGRGYRGGYHMGYGNSSLDSCWR